MTPFVRRRNRYEPLKWARALLTPALTVPDTPRSRIFIAISVKAAIFAPPRCGLYGLFASWRLICCWLPPSREIGTKIALSLSESQSSLSKGKPPMRLADFINDRVLAPFDVRITRASAWKQKQKREARSASAVGAERILKLGSLLAPQHAVGQSKVRLGSKYDGGYICLNDFDGITTAFSFGIGQNDDWDFEIAGKGIVVHQFDHS